MSSLPELSEVLHVLSPIEDRYFGLGIHLGIKIQQLKSIESNYPDISRRLTEIISLWQENSTGESECSWSTLAKAVERIGGHDRLAKELRERDAHETEPQRCTSTASYTEDVTGYFSKSEPQTGDLKPQRPHDSTKRSRVDDSSMLDSIMSAGDSCRPQRHDSTQSGDESGYSSKSDSIHSDNSSGSEAECFELAPGCGCTSKKPCSLYKFCAGGCPNPTRKRVPVLRKKSKGSDVPQIEIPFEEEYDFEEYEERTKEIQKLFGMFVCKTSHLFKASSVSIKELNLYLQGAYPVMKPRMEELSKATFFEDFFRIIVDQACSWFDYGIIKDLIHCFCISAKSCLEEYEAHFKEYAEQRLPKGMKHIEIGSSAKKGGKQLVIKIDKEWEEVTFSDLDKLRGTFASILSIRRSDLYLADIREGCIMMTFMITGELAGRLFPSRSCLTSSQVKSFKNEGVISLRCGKLSWRAANSSKVKAKAVPQNTLGWRLKIFDLHVMMTVMLLLASVLAGFGVLARMQDGRLQKVNNNRHTRANFFNLRDNTTHNIIFWEPSSQLIAKSQPYLDSSPELSPTTETQLRNVTHKTEIYNSGQLQVNHEAIYCLEELFEITAEGNGPARVLFIFHNNDIKSRILPALPYYIWHRKYDSDENVLRDPFYYSLTAYQTHASRNFNWILPSQSSGRGLLPRSTSSQLHLCDKYYSYNDSIQTRTAAFDQSSTFCWKLPCQSSGHGLLPCSTSIHLHICDKHYYYNGSIHKNGTWSYLHTFRCETNILNQPKPKRICTEKIISFSCSQPKKEHLCSRLSNIVARNHRSRYRDERNRLQMELKKVDNNFSRFTKILQKWILQERTLH